MYALLALLTSLAAFQDDSAWRCPRCGSSGSFRPAVLKIEDIPLFESCEFHHRLAQTKKPGLTLNNYAEFHGVKFGLLGGCKQETVGIVKPNEHENKYTWLRIFIIDGDTLGELNGNTLGELTDLYGHELRTYKIPSPLTMKYVYVPLIREEESAEAIRIVTRKFPDNAIVTFAGISRTMKEVRSIWTDFGDELLRLKDTDYTAMRHAVDTTCVKHEISEVALKTIFENSEGMRLKLGPESQFAVFRLKRYALTDTAQEDFSTAKTAGKYSIELP